MSNPKVYLAGPEVFLPDPHPVAHAKKRLCKRYGFEGVFPFDVSVDADLGSREMGYRISAANEELIRGCQLLIANMTPFRGPSADVGTAFEMGFARGLGIPVFAYTNASDNFRERTITFLNRAVRQRSDGNLEDADGMRLETHDLVDNLMLDCAVHASGDIVVSPTPAATRFTDLSGFEACLVQAGKLFKIA